MNRMPTCVICLEKIKVYAVNADNIGMQPALYFDGAFEERIEKDKFVRCKKTNELWFVLKGLKTHSICQKGLEVKKFQNKNLWVSLEYLDRTGNY